MSVTKKIFKQLIVGKIIDHIPLEELFDKRHEPKVKKAMQIALEIVAFAEEHKLFRSDLN